MAAMKRATSRGTALGKDAECFGNGGELIYKADKAELDKLIERVL
jgi:hypothetical protein